MMKLPYMMRALPRLSGLMLETKVLEIAENKVLTDKGAIDDVEAVILATGYVPVRGLAEELKDSALEIAVVGDAEAPAQIYEATHSAFKAAYAI
jgi:hypothetical protein